MRRLFQFLQWLLPLNSSHSVFEQRHIGDDEIGSITRTHIITGAMGAFFARTFMISSLYFAYFAFECGFTKYQIGLLSSAVSLMVFFQLLAYKFEEKYGMRKYPWYILSCLSRLALLPLLFLDKTMLVPLVVIGVRLACTLLSSLAMPLWLSWVHDLIPERRMGVFWATRSKGVKFILLGLTMLPAIAMDLTVGEYKFTCLRGIFAAAIVLSVVDILWHIRIVERPTVKRLGNRFLREIVQPLKDGRFRNWVFARSLWTFSAMVAGPFCIPYMLQDLKMRSFTINTLITISMPLLLSMVLIKIWGRMCDSRGPRPVLVICHLFWATIPGWYYLTGVTHSLVVLVPWAIAGLVTAGSFIAQRKVNSSLRGRKTTCLAVLAVMVMFSGGMGALAGSLVLKHFGILNCFLASLVLRLLSVLPFAFLALPRGGAEQ